MDKVENYDTEKSKSTAFHNPKTKHDLAQHPNILQDRHIMYCRRIRRSLRYYQSALARLQQSPSQVASLWTNGGAHEIRRFDAVRRPPHIESISPIAARLGMFAVFSRTSSSPMAGVEAAAKTPSIPTAHAIMAAIFMETPKTCPRFQFTGLDAPQHLARSERYHEGLIPSL